MKKKFFVFLLLCLIGAFALSGCSDSKKSSDDDDKKTTKSSKKNKDDDDDDDEKSSKSGKNKKDNEDDEDDDNWDDDDNDNDYDEDDDDEKSSANTIVGTYKAIDAEGNENDIKETAACKKYEVYNVLIVYADGTAEMIPLTGGKRSFTYDDRNFSQKSTKFAYTFRNNTLNIYYTQSGKECCIVYKKMSDSEKRKFEAGYSAEDIEKVTSEL